MWLRTVAHKGFHAAPPSSERSQLLDKFSPLHRRSLSFELVAHKEGLLWLSQSVLCVKSDNLVTSVKQEGRASAGMTSQMPNHSLKKRLISFHHRRWAGALKPNVCAIQKISLEADGKHTTVYHAGMRNTVLLSSTVSGVVHFIKIVSEFASPPLHHFVNCASSHQATTIWWY